tara:strand:- start:2186 stop:3022 length:837 start_codon:yes stop_codon:yes gene_type:complete
MKKNLDLITVHSINVLDTLDILYSHGICILKNYVSSSDISKLLIEHESSFNLENCDGIYSTEKHPTNKYGLVSRGRIKNLSDKFSTTRSIFSSNFIKDISDRYFGSKSLVCNDIFFTHEKESNVPILPWHFDRQQSLKFYINLVNVNKTNGAFEYDIGSHREGHFRANFYILSGVKVGDIPNDITDNELHNPTTIIADAGDLIIFDPDGFHRGGVIMKGLERKVMRGQSHPIPNRGYTARFFDTHWWLQSPLNIVKFIKNNAIRRLPYDRLSKAAVRK